MGSLLRPWYSEEPEGDSGPSSQLMQGMLANSGLGERSEVWHAATAGPSRRQLERPPTHEQS